MKDINGTFVLQWKGNNLDPIQFIILTNAG